MSQDDGYKGSYKNTRLFAANSLTRKCKKTDDDRARVNLKVQVISVSELVRSALCKNLLIPK